MAKLHFRPSTMGAGKTYDLLRVAYNYEKDNNLKVLVLKPKIDTRNDDLIKSRNGESRKCDFLIDNDMDIYHKIKYINEKADIILIDEAQFLTKKQVYELSDIVDNLNIPIICYGLRVDYQMNLFEGSAALFAIADEFGTPDNLITVDKKGKRCTHVLRFENGKAIFSGEQIKIGGNEFYMPCTRKEWKKAKNEK